MSLAIRPAQMRDGDGLLALIREHARFEQAEATISGAELGRVLAAPAPVRLIVAEDAATLIGYAALTFDYALWRGHTFAHLDCLFVRENDRGRGIGKRLFARALAAARDSGADRMEWQTPDWNSPAIEFYQHQGATGQPKRRFHLLLGPKDVVADEQFLP